MATAPEFLAPPLYLNPFAANRTVIVDRLGMFVVALIHPRNASPPLYRIGMLDRPVLIARAPCGCMARTPEIHAGGDVHHQHGLGPAAGFGIAPAL